MVTLRVEPQNLDECMGTLRFAQRAKAVPVVVKANVSKVKPSADALEAELDAATDELAAARALIGKLTAEQEAAMEVVRREAEEEARLRSAGEVAMAEAWETQAAEARREVESREEELARARESIERLARDKEELGALRVAREAELQAEHAAEVAAAAAAAEARRAEWEARQAELCTDNDEVRRLREELEEREAERAELIEARVALELLAPKAAQLGETRAALRELQGAHATLLAEAEHTKAELARRNEWLRRAKEKVVSQNAELVRLRGRVAAAAEPSAEGAQVRRLEERLARRENELAALRTMHAEGRAPQGCAGGSGGSGVPIS